MKIRLQVDVPMPEAKKPEQTHTDQFHLYARFRGLLLEMGYGDASIDVEVFE